MEMAKSSKSSFNSNEQHSEPRLKREKDEYPGPINNQEQMKALTVVNDANLSEFLPLIDDVHDNRYLRPPSDI